MTEEIAHVAGSTADTPGPVGRVSNVLNQTTTERRASPKGMSSIGATQTRERQMLNKYDTHCAIPLCTCTHDYCYKGWIDTATGTTTAPCPYCRASLDERLHRAQQARGKGYPPEAYQRILASVKR